MKKIIASIMMIWLSTMWISAAPSQNEELSFNAAAALPLFIQNQGQVDGQVKYYLKSSGMTVYLTEAGLIFDIIRNAKQNEERLVIRLNFKNAAEPEIRGTKPHQAVMHYFSGNSPNQRHTMVPAFREVLIRNIYPRIDMRLYTENHVLRYDFIVHPGADPAQVQLSYEGIEELFIDKDQLVADTVFGDFIQTQPRIYQQSGSKLTSINGKFTLQGDHAYGFAIDSFNPNRPLVIDPALQFSTYLGGGSLDEVKDAAFLSSGVIATGTSNSLDFPAYSGYDTSHNGNRDVFVTKFDENGNLVFSTFVGGSGNETGTGLFCDTNHIFVTGSTGSSDFPTAGGAFQNSRQGGTDAFLVDLNAAGSSLNYATYIGGTDGDLAEAVCGDNRYVYICGSTNSSDFPNYSPPGTPFQSNLKGIKDAFAVSFQRSNLSLLYYATYIGGSGVEEGFDISVDSSNQAIITGTTSGESGGGAWFPTTSGAYQTAYGGGAWDGFVTKLTIFGDSAVFSTFLGGSDSDLCQSITLESNQPGITGYTFSSDFPLQNEYQSSRRGSSDAFITQFNTAGSGLLYSTYFGGNGQDYGRAVTYDYYGRLHVAGKTNSSNLPLKDAYQSTQKGNTDAFAAKFDPSQSGGSSLLFSTYLGGTGSGTNEEEAWGIASSDIAAYSHLTVVGGSTSSSDFPTTNAYQNTYQGGGDGFITIFNASDIDADPGSIDFGKVAAGESSSWTTVTVSSTGSGVLHCGSVSLTGSNPGQFSTRNDNISGTSLLPGDTATIEVRFEPGSTGNKSAFLTIPNSTENADPVNISLSGKGITTPNVFITSLLALQQTTASFQNLILSNGGSAVTAYGMCWNTTGEPTLADDHTEDGSGTGVFISNISGLNPSETYYVRAYASNAAGTAYTPEAEITTLDPVVPTVTTASVTGITDDSAQSGGEVTDNGGSAVTARGVCWNTTGSPTIADNRTADGSGTGVFTSSMTGLSPGQTYYVRAYAENTAGTGYGGQETFTTLDIPNVTYTPVSSVTDTTAQSGGNVIDDGGTAVTARGVCWNTTGSPTIADSHTTDGSGTGTFTSSMTGLTPGESYFVRAYADNSIGTAYSSTEQEFTTLTLPTVITSSVSSIGYTSAEAEGQVTDNGGTTVTDRGICWNTTGSPTLADNSSAGGSGLGTFTAGLNGLTPDTTYYIRAYAVNSIGAVYGSELSFSTLPYENYPSSYQVIPEAIWAPASGGGTWMTEVQITDITGDSEVSVYFNTSTGERRGPITLYTSPGRNMSVKAGNILNTLDQLDTGFSYYGTAGALEFLTQDTDHKIHVTARTKNGNYSKTFSGLNHNDDNTAGGSRVMMIQNLVSNETFRTAYGGFNPTDDAVTVEYTLIDGSGAVIGTPFSKTFSARQYQAFSPFTEAGVPYPGSSYTNTWLKITPISGAGQLMSYAATANNITSDPAVHTAVQAADTGGYNSPSNYLVIPEILWAPASGGGTWMTEVQITDITGGSDISVYYNTSSGERRGPIALFTGSGPGVSVKTGNLLQTLDLLDPGFDYYATAGTVEFFTQDNSHTINVMTRTSNGNYAKTFSGINLHEANTVSGSRRMMIQNLVSDSDYRTAVGAFNPTDETVTIKFTIKDADRNTIGTAFTKTFTARQYQAFDPFSEAGVPYPGNSNDNTWIRIQVESGSGAVIVYGATADNITSDPAVHRAVQR